MWNLTLAARQGVKTMCCCFLSPSYQWLLEPSTCTITESWERSMEWGGGGVGPASIYIRTEKFDYIVCPSRYTVWWDMISRWTHTGVFFLLQIYRGRDVTDTGNTIDMIEYGAIKGSLIKEYIYSSHLIIYTLMTSRSSFYWCRALWDSMTSNRHAFTTSSFAPYKNMP